MQHNPSPPITIGLTGGIGSGKSTVSQCLFELFQIPTIDTDAIAKEIVQPNSEGLKAIIQQFGQEILNPDNTLNRRQLREIIFNHPAQKRQLEAILHPLIEHCVKAKLSQLKHSTNAPAIVVAIPLLAEKIQKEGQIPCYLDQIWVVDATPEQQLKQASQRDQATPKQIQKIIDQQASRAERLAIADIVIDNTGNLAHLQRQLQHLFPLKKP